MIGINSAKYADEEVEGMGFAIPISTAVPIINDIIKSEAVSEDEQGYLGIKGTDVSEEYAKYYNKTQNRVGFVFRNRFDSKTIYNQEYLLQCIKYIHMNPVKSKVVKAEEEYEYSSYRNYLDNTKIYSKILLLDCQTDPEN